MVTADLLYVPDCPNRNVALHRLTEAAARTGGEIVVRQRLVTDADTAAEVGVHGHRRSSPTAVTVLAPSCAIRLALAPVVARDAQPAVAAGAALLVVFLFIRSWRFTDADCC